MIIRQKYLEKIEKWIDRPMIKAITGIRRCGKSYLLRMTRDLLLTKGVEVNSICEINLELYENKHLLNNDTLYDYIKTFSQGKKRTYVFIDEIQYCKGWEKIIASLLAEDSYDIYITGSNAALLSGDLATHIAGRYIEIKVYPLSYSEFKLFTSKMKNKNLAEESLFFQYLKYGGFPGLFTVLDDDEAKDQYLNGIRNTIVLRDTVQRHDIRDVDLLGRVLNFVFDNIGQVFSANSVTNYLKSIGIKASLMSVNAYLDALSDAMIIEKAKRLDIKGKKIMKRLEKYFVADLGIRYSDLGYRDNDIGQLLENIIFNELLFRGYKVFVGKEGETEVDFVAIKGEERVYYQVTYLLSSEAVVNREYAPLLQINDSYPKYVLSMDTLPVAVKDGIRHKNVIEFLNES